MLLSKKERLAEATISLAEIKAIKNVLIEAKLSRNFEELRSQLVQQLKKNLSVFNVVLDFTAPTNLRSFDTFIKQLRSTTEKYYRILVSKNLTNEMFYVEGEVAGTIHDLGVYTAEFIKSFSEIVADFPEFRQKAESASPDKPLNQIFSKAELDGMESRYQDVLKEKVTIYSLLTQDEYDAEKETGKFQSISADMDSLLGNLASAYADRSKRAKNVGLTIDNENISLAFDKNNFINELLSSKFSSVNPMLGKLKLSKKATKQDVTLKREEALKKFFANPEDKNEESIWPNKQLYLKSLVKLQEKLSKFLEEDQEDDNEPAPKANEPAPKANDVKIGNDGKDFIKFVNELLKKKEIDYLQLFDLMKSVVKEMSVEIAGAS